MAIRRCVLTVRGLVEGVGFRPFLAALARERGLAGSVRGAPGGLLVEVEGPEEAVREFSGALFSAAPPLSVVDSVDEAWGEPAGAAGFRTGAGDDAQTGEPPVPPDAAPCAACLAEMRTPGDRRHRYPLLGCAACGPRLSVAEGAPLDRARTSLRAFTPCAQCLGEAGDPASRRYGDPAVACPACGPRAWLVTPTALRKEGEAALAEAARRLAAGETLAVRGPSGFHLVVDAASEPAVARLRARRRRDRKPLAVLVGGLDEIAVLALVTPGDEQILRSPAAPIVLLPAFLPSPLAPSVSPGTTVVGAMLPPSPLHAALLQAFAAVRTGPGPAALALCSGNPRGEPVAVANDDAQKRLAGMADAFLLHDREIVSAADDTVLDRAPGPRLLRRGRGFLPLPLALPVAGPVVLGIGGDVENAFCLTRGGEAFPGPGSGDLQGAPGAERFVEAVQRFADLLGARPEVVVHELDAESASARLARQLAEGPFRGARLVPVDHGHAHVLACLAEAGTVGPALGLVLDGPARGPDGESCGGEILRVDGLHFERLAALSPLRLPGGDLALRAPWRIAVAAACELGAGSIVARLVRRWPSAPVATVESVLRLCRGGGDLPKSTSLARLFDAAAAMAGIRDDSGWDGESSAALEQAAGPLPGPKDLYPVTVDTRVSPVLLDARPMLGALLDDALRGANTGAVAARFLATVVDLLARGTEEASKRTGIATVALSGGCLRNRLLLEALTRRLSGAGLQVLAPAAVPCDEGGLALGQAVAGVLAAGGR